LDENAAAIGRARSGEEFRHFGCGALSLRPHIVHRWAKALGTALGTAGEIVAGPARGAEALSTESLTHSGAPGRPTSRHLVEQELARRIAGHELVGPSIKAEAERLETWLKASHPSLPHMSAKTIGNSFRSKIRDAENKISGEFRARFSGANCRSHVPDARGIAPLTANGAFMDKERNPVPRISLTPTEATQATGFSVRRFFEAIADQEMTARKSRDGGKATVIEVVELQRWLRSLPTRGRPPEDQSNKAQRLIREGCE
jgi:hypothetical protein